MFIAVIVCKRWKLPIMFTQESGHAHAENLIV